MQTVQVEIGERAPEEPEPPEGEAEIEVAEAFEALTRGISKLRLGAGERQEVERLLCRLYEALGGRWDWQ